MVEDKHLSIGRNPRHDLRGDLNRQPVPQPPVCTVGLRIEANRKFGSRERGFEKTPHIKEGTQPWVHMDTYESGFIPYSERLNWGEGGYSQACQRAGSHVIRVVRARAWTLAALMPSVLPPFLGALVTETK